MINKTLKSDIDRLWDSFWTGGITNPLTVIEQITYLIFLRLLDARESRDEKRQERTGRAFRQVYGPEQQELRWSRFKHKGAAELLPFVRDQVFAHLRNLGNGSGLSEFMADAQLMIQKPSLLVEAVNMVDQLPLTTGDQKGDLYEYLLSKLTTAGIAGQFRTPRHIIRLMVEMLDPKPTETVADPACGTAGFLVGVMEYLQERYTSEAGRIETPEGPIYSGDLLAPYAEHIQSKMFNGFDFDVSMLRIARMNLWLHGVEDPEVHYRDTLSNSFPERFPAAASDAFDVILANPPFTGSLDYKDVHPSLLRRVKTKKTELLFLALILRMLHPGGRSATIVPDGVLFGMSKAHRTLRKELVEEHQLEGVISLPQGAFRPYTGVSTAVLVFTKGGKTDQVFFYDVERDGYSLDDKRDPASEVEGPLGPVEGNDLPRALETWRARREMPLSDRTSPSFAVPVDEIRGNNYDLSIGRYREVVYHGVDYEPPETILAAIRSLQREIEDDLVALEKLL